MKFFEMLGDFFSSPIEKIIQGVDTFFGNIGSYFGSLFEGFKFSVVSGLIGMCHVIIISYSVYCAYRVIITHSEETFSKYINRGMILSLCYFFSRYGGKLLLHYIGG